MRQLQELLTLPEQSYLLALARESIRAALLQNATIGPVRELPFPRLHEPRGCFVTLTHRGSLRGCVGCVRPRLALFQAVVENARRAATEDPRFPPVEAEELNDLRIELSVLTLPVPLRFSSAEDLIRKLHPGRDGVTLSMHGREVTYLPQVWTHLPDPVPFLSSLSEKAGCCASAWRDPGTEVCTYQTVSFAEPVSE